jgi:gliding motility-associated-like protein
MKTTGILIVFISFLQIGWSQCTWTSIFFDSYEYTSVISGIIPGTTYQNTPQTYAGCTRTGSSGMYLNILDGFTGLIFSQSFPNVCVGQNYRFSFSTRDAWSSTNNLTFNVYDSNNALLSTQTVSNTSTWNDVTMSSFTATTSTIRFEIVTNLVGGPGNDAGFDDLRLSQCQPTPINYTITKCIGTPDFDLYNEQSGTFLSQAGLWTGPTTLQNGYSGTFNPATNTNGTYTYTIDGAVGCADSTALFSVQVISTPIITTATAVEGCESATLPAITGTNITSQASYYTGTNATGTSYDAGAVISTSQTLYMYDGTTGCSDEEPITITIYQPNSAGNDDVSTYCTQPGVLDLNTYVGGNSGAAGSWIETTNPPSGTFTASNGNFDTDGLPDNSYTFDYIVPTNGPCLQDTAVITITLSSDLSVDLGNDTTFCAGQGTTLSPGSYDSYLWDNNSTSATRYVSLPGTYWVKTGVMGDNVIINGDFEAGNSNFTTQYSPGSGGAWGLLSNAGTYAITTSPNLVHTNFTSCTDHTPNPGTKMLVVNGSGNPNTNVWCQNVPVQPNTEYQFSTWVTSAVNDPNVAQLQFNINSTNIGNVFSPSPTGCNWSQFYQIWNSGMNVSAQICIVNQNTNTGGNDFVLDDISFAPICTASDTIVIGNYPLPVITVSPNDTICQGETATLSITSPAPISTTYTWNPGAMTGASINVSPLTSTVYTVNATSAEGCVSANVSRTVLVRPTPVASIFVNGNDTICNRATVLMDGTSTIANSTLLWSPSGNTAQQEVVTPNQTTNYTLTVTTPAGCSDDTTVALYVIPDLILNITGSTTFCEGSQTTLTATSNQPGTNFQWFPGGQTGNQVNVSSAGWVYLTGEFFFCPQVHDSIEITTLPNPVVTAPADVEVCPGEVVDVTATSSLAGSTFTWYPGNMTGATATIAVNSTTTVYVTAQNGSCVSSPDSLIVSVSGACFLNIPNVFTPNGDQMNDYFQLINYDGITTLSCVILNRWGGIVREFNTPNFQWDGTDKSGNNVSEGVYFYKISATTQANEELNEHGMVEVVFD